MGGGNYSYSNASLRNCSYYSHADVKEVFSQREINSQMNPKNQVRECCENTEHPDTFPIIIGLDVTGSMGHVPAHLIKVDFIEVMKKILDEGVLCPQVCFVAIGDDRTDHAPLQIGQFEANDELMEKWLTTTWLEGCGGGNNGESYSLAHYFAARHTSCDAITKRGKKGLLITVGDEANHDSYSEHSISKIFGDNVEDTITSETILEEAKAGWDIYHINILDYSGNSAFVQKNLNKWLGDHVINVEANNDTNISNVIAALAIKSYKEQYSNTITKSSEAPQQML